MSFFGNLLWILCGGLVSSILWLIAGVFWCLTIIGIPYGLQCFKFSELTLAPFGKEVVYDGGVVSLLANIIWIIFFFPPMFVVNLCLGIILCLTIVGIPFGLQFFKIAKLTLMPFGARIINN